MSSRPSGPRVLILGGSLINGLGHDGPPFGHLVAERLGASDVLDLTAVSRTCADTLDIGAEQIRGFHADVALLCVGGTESLMRPSIIVQRLIERYAPATWHGVAGLEPRARFSRSPLRRVRQRVESRLKVGIKHLLFRVFRGGKPRTPFEQLTGDIDRLLATVTSSTARTLVIGLPGLDDHLFPGTDASFRRTNAYLRSRCDPEHGSHFLPLDGALVQWDDYVADHFHLSATGHAHVAELVVAALGDTEQVTEDELPSVG